MPNSVKNLLMLCVIVIVMATTTRSVIYFAGMINPKFDDPSKYVVLIGYRDARGHIEEVVTLGQMTEYLSEDLAVDWLVARGVQFAGSAELSFSPARGSENHLCVSCIEGLARAFGSSVEYWNNIDRAWRGV